jgi:hypothetical protein
MRFILPLVCLALLAGCVTTPDTQHARVHELSHKTAAHPGGSLTLELRYDTGETLSLETRVILLNGTGHASTRLKDCDVTPADDSVRFTTGGLVKPGVTCHVLIEQPGEPAQVFDIPVPPSIDRLGAWSDWRRPVAQLVSPMPAQALAHKTGNREKLTIPPSRQFEIRYRFSAFTARPGQG